MPAAAGTVIEAVRTSLIEAARYNRNLTVRPVAILWPDEQREWESLVPYLRSIHPYLITLGSYDPQSVVGPAIWVKCMLAGQLEAAIWPPEAMPVVYLPAVARHMLRAGEHCPRLVQPLVELAYRGVIWSQTNGHDWTVMAFLRSQDGGLGLDVAQDRNTAEAVKWALVPLAHTSVSGLQARPLEASDFNQLLSPDPARDMLLWLSDAPATRQCWTPNQWEAFRAVCMQEYGFDPQTDDQFVGAEYLGRRTEKWGRVWERFLESPRSYPGLPALLRKVEPQAQNMFDDPSPWPGTNETEEKHLRARLGNLDSASPREACQVLLQLEAEHGRRRGWVWAELGRAPLAKALKHLVDLANVTATNLGGTGPNDMAKLYTEGAWRADEAVLCALACIDRAEDFVAVKSAIRAVYCPWLEDSTERLQDIVDKHGIPSDIGCTPAMPGECVLFVDGLRFDLGQAFLHALLHCGLSATLGWRWAALPSVTATCKPAASPIAPLLTGTPETDDFLPVVAATGERLVAPRFRRLLADQGHQYIGPEETGDPIARGWTEHHGLDPAGHNEGWKIARRVDEVLRELLDRVHALLNAGWSKVTVITDHGWLLVPGGLPKAHLAGYLAETRWGRCAVLKPSAHVAGHIATWRWSDDVRIMLAPGSSCFRADTEYAHGGLSLQECVTPTIDVSHRRPQGQPQVDRVEWRGLRCRVHVTNAAAGTAVDLRAKADAPDTSFCGGSRRLDPAGQVSLLVADDSSIGRAAFVVVLDTDDTVMTKATTTIGGTE